MVKHSADGFTKKPTNTNVMVNTMGYETGMAFIISSPVLLFFFHIVLAMSSRASDTAVDEKSIIEEEITVADEPSNHVEWKEPPDGGWKAWLVVFGSFCVGYIYAS